MSSINNNNNNNSQQSSSNNSSILRSAREYIHEKVKTDEIREAEKSPFEKVKESLPSSVHEAGEKAKGAVDSGVQSFKDGFQERLNENSAGDKIRDSSTEPSMNEQQPGPISKAKDATLGTVTNLREKIYDATKSAEERKAEEEAKKPLPTQIYNRVGTTLGSAVESAKPASGEDLQQKD